MKLKSRPIVCSCAVVLLLALSLRADDWPKWRGPDGDGIVKEKDLLQSWPDAGLKQLWTADVGIGYSTPVAKDGKVYLLSTVKKTEVLTAFDASSGAVLWSQSNDAKPTPDYPGARATPTIDGDFIYTVGADDDVICRKIADGSLVWQSNVLQETKAVPIHFGEASSPLVTDKFVYVQGGRDEPPKPGNAKPSTQPTAATPSPAPAATTPICLALDKQTGKIVWQSQQLGVSGYAPPLLITVGDKPMLIVFAATGITGLDPQTGTAFFCEPWKTQYDVNATTPIYRDGKMFISSGYGKSSAQFSVSADGLKQTWKCDKISSKFSTPIFQDGVLYANTSDDGGMVACINWDTGKILWAIKDKDYNLGMGGNLLRFDQKLIGLSQNGTLMLIDATPEKGTGIAHFTAGLTEKKAEVWSAPMVYDHKLYVKGINKFVCFDVSAKNYPASATPTTAPDAK